MPQGEYIDAVEVITHGHVETRVDASDYGIGYLLFNGGKFYSKRGDYMGVKDKSIDDIKPKNISYLYFSACNTANYDFNVNIVQAFYHKNPFAKTVAGWDGGVGFVFNSFFELIETNKDMPTSDESNPTWKLFAKAKGHPNRPRHGYMALYHQYFVPTK